MAELTEKQKREAKASLMAILADVGKQREFVSPRSRGGNNENFARALEEYIASRTLLEMPGMKMSGPEATRQKKLALINSLVTASAPSEGKQQLLNALLSGQLSYSPDESLRVGLQLPTDGIMRERRRDPGIYFQKQF